MKTLQRWDREGKLKPLRTPSNRRQYTDDHIRQALGLRGVQIAPTLRKIVVYLRVSSQAQRPDLENQRTALEQFCTARGLTVDEMSARISERAGYWFVSIHVQMPAPERQAPERVIGVDLGIKSLAVDSDGEVFENQKHLTNAQKKLRRLNRWLARKQKGSKNWMKAKRKLARLHLRIANLRADATHKLTTRLAAKASIIALETLNVIGMLKNHKLARAIADASFAEIVRHLGYKAMQVVLIDPFYPSSKRCNGCGHINPDLTLADRVWTCPVCGAVLDRDVNAARNIRDEGMRLVGAA